MEEFCDEEFLKQMRAIQTEEDLKVAAPFPESDTSNSNFKLVPLMHQRSKSEIGGQNDEIQMRQKRTGTVMIKLKEFNEHSLDSIHLKEEENLE